MESISLTGDSLGSVELPLFFGYLDIGEGEEEVGFSLTGINGGPAADYYSKD